MTLVIYQEEGDAIIFAPAKDAASPVLRFCRQLELVSSRILAMVPIQNFSPSSFLIL